MLNQPLSFRLPRQAGFSLIEVLIALLVLSIGMLGFAALQLTALHSSQSSYERSIAVLQADDLVERMWAGLCDLHDSNGSLIEAEAEAIKTAWEEAHSESLANLDWNSPALKFDKGPLGTMIELTIEWSDRAPREGEDGSNRFVHYFQLPALEC